MRFLLLYLLFSFSQISNINSQIAIDLSPSQILIDTMVSNLEDDEWIEIFTELINVYNIGTDTIDLRWTRIKPLDCPEIWDSRGNDEYQSYPTFVDSNYPLGYEIMLPPGESTIFYLSVLPRSKPGCCTFTIEFLDNNDTTVILPSALIEYRINDSKCLITSTIEQAEMQIAIYPNPAQNELRIEGPQSEDLYYRIYSSSGAECMKGNLFSNVLNIDQLTSGLYFIQISDLSTGKSKTLEFLKGS